MNNEVYENEIKEIINLLNENISSLNTLEGSFFFTLINLFLFSSLLLFNFLFFYF